jgi:polyisoprenyl-phosphate glycosyltransferase|tara:strand:- start:59 stop:1003 length:945 start_codon:yes stop_codon:yes gene_type:complete
MNKKLSVIFSFYNEEKNIKKSIDEVLLVLNKIENLDYELIYVNDCSTDSSFDILKKEYLINNKIKIINLSRRFGHMAGIMAGLKNCKGDAAIYLDIDLQDPPELIKSMVHAWINENYDVVFTTRKKREQNWFMKLLTKTGYKILEKTSYINMAKDSGDFRLIDRKVIDQYINFKEINPFFRFLVDFIGFRKKQIYYNRENREFGKSNFSLYKIFYQFFEISLVPFSDFPIRMALIFGLVSFFVCTIILIRTAYLYLSGVVIISSTSIFGAILLFGGIQSLILGILAVYIGSIFKETKQRPIYIVQEKIGFHEEK